VHGRDRNFRPIFVNRPAVLLSLDVKYPSSNS
jgi:hypothetical protein